MSKGSQLILTSVAITTTAKNVDCSIREWCSYHLQVVDRIFLWLDDPAEVHSPLIPSDRRLEVQVGTQSEVGSVHGNLMVRQEENANRALDLCCKQGIEWIVHLDIDEILYPADRETLARVLIEPIDQVIIMNHEVCAQWFAESPFRQCNYFKLNGKFPFNFYGNGKAAVRCRDGVFARGAHRFLGNVSRPIISRELVLLHYACATFDRWLKKYALLGDFPDFWWDDPRHPIGLPFHLKSRDVCKQCLVNGNFSPAMDFWKQNVLSATEISRLVGEDKVGWYQPIPELVPEQTARTPSPSAQNGGGLPGADTVPPHAP